MATATQTKKRHKLAPMYKVLLHNDDIHTFEEVIHALQEVFKFERMKCVKIAYEAHNNGVALCKVEPLEWAEMHQGQLQSFGLTATIEPA